MMIDFVTLLDGVGTLAFALSGCIVAANKKTDIVGFWFLANTAGIGGGTIRDCVLGLTPVFWVKDPTALILCSIVALSSYWLLRDTPKFRPLLIWADALGLAFFAIVGASITLDTGAPWFIAVLLGTLTAVGGGIVRDLLAGEPTLILRREVYASACVAGIVAYIALMHGWVAGFTLDRPNAMWTSVALIFILRALAIHYRVELSPHGEKSPLTRRERDSKE